MLLLHQFGILKRTKLSTTLYETENQLETVKKKHTHNKLITNFFFRTSHL